MKKKRIPRKIKKKIPKNTPYCYQIDNKKQRKEKGFVFHIKSCVFYKYTGSIFGHCKLFNCEVEDQCKSCGLRY